MTIVNANNPIQIPTPTVPGSTQKIESFYEQRVPEVVGVFTGASENGTITLCDYDNISWEQGERPAELDEATTIGTKTLPGAGPFYFANHEDGTPTLGHIDNADNVGV